MNTLALASLMATLVPRPPLPPILIPPQLLNTVVLASPTPMATLVLRPPLPPILIQYYTGSILPELTATAVAAVTADLLESDGGSPALFASWVVPLSEALCHLVGGEYCDSSPWLKKRNLHGGRIYDAERGVAEADPSGTGWHRDPCKLLVHMLCCVSTDGSCAGGQYCVTAKVTLAHLYSCEEPECEQCVTWACMKCKQVGMVGQLHRQVIGESPMAMHLLYSALPTYLKTQTVNAIN